MVQCRIFRLLFQLASSSTCVAATILYCKTRLGMRERGEVVGKPQTIKITGRLPE
jgi:hypothetical protein